MRIEQSTLPSGLTVISGTLPDFESASLLVMVNAGARDESAACNGVAHFLEHMAFKGTATRTAFDIAVQIECLGADINAFTSREATAYYIDGPRHVMEEALVILGDVLSASRFDTADIDMERGVIAQEIARRNDNPGALCGEGLYATAYPNHPMGRTILGNPDFVANATRDDLLAFIGRHYRTGRMVVVATGNIEHAWLVDHVARNFASLPQGSTGKTRTEPRYAGGQFLHFRKDFSQVNMALAFPSVALDAPDQIAHQLLAAALGDGMSSPLFQEVREKRGLVYGVGAFSSHGDDSGLFGISAGMTLANLPAVLETACIEARRSTETIGERDFMRARNMFLAQLASVKERPFPLARYLAGQFFRHGQARGPEGDIARIRAVTIEELLRAAKTVFAGRPTLSLVGPMDEADHLATVTATLA